MFAGELSLTWAFDLEQSQGVGGPDHLVDGWVVSCDLV